ncbi:MAG: ABC transporter permease [Clostridia bacterium]|nr:ABC transporter permease [Clostridia bacterium]
MTLLRLAYRNVRENRRTYFGFLASSVFAVVVFYLFAAFRALPAVVEGHYPGARSVASGLQVCQYLIIAFSIFFTLYSNSAFVKSRKRELGVLALLGAQRRQLSLLLFGESIIVGITSIAAGLGLGGLFVRLFVMAIDRILMSPEPLPFVIQFGPILTTTFTYLALFVVISALNIVSINTSQVIQLVKAPAKPKTPPVYSRRLVALGIAFLASGYAVAWTVSEVGVVVAFLPVTAIVCVGTHILFTQASVAVLRRLQRRKSVYYKQTNLLTISDLVFKMKDNARILAQVAILSAVVLTASGVIYTLGTGPAEDAKNRYARAVSFVLPATHDSVRIAQHFRDRLVAAGAVITDSAIMSAIQVEVPDISKKAPGLIVPADDYNRWARETGMLEAHLNYGHVVRILRNPESRTRPDDAGQIVHAIAGATDLAFVTDGAISAPLVSGMGDAAFLLVCDNGRFAELMRDLPAKCQETWFSCELSNWKRARKAEQAAMEAFPQGYPMAYASRVKEYSQMMASLNMLMLVAMFVAFLFFLAAGSMLYFRFFLEIQEDQARYVALRRIGLSWREIRGIVTREMAVLFFAPWVVAFVHQMVALRSFSTVTPMMPIEVWKYGAAAAGIFLALQTVYFLLARGAYLQELAPAVK